MEFKFAVWQPGWNAARKQAVFHDLVHLAADQSGRRAELYCVGPQLARFLRTTTSPVSWDSIDRRSELGSCTKRSSAPSTRRFPNSQPGPPLTCTSWTSSRSCQGCELNSIDEPVGRAVHSAPPQRTRLP
jgi:hypothetical protein